MAFSDSPLKLNDKCLPCALLDVMFLRLSVDHFFLVWNLIVIGGIQIFQHCSFS